MEEEKKSAEEIVPKEEKKNLDEYPDHLKSPQFDLSELKTTEGKPNLEEKKDS